MAYFAPVVPPIAGPIPDPLMNWVTELSNVSAEQRWVLLTNLKAAAAYQFRVSAVNSVGEGSPSAPSNAVKLPQEGKAWNCKVVVVNRTFLLTCRRKEFCFKRCANLLCCHSTFLWKVVLIHQGVHTTDLPIKYK